MNESAFTKARREARGRSESYERQAMAVVPAVKASIIDSAVGGGTPSFGGDQKRQVQTAQGYQHFRHWVYVAVSLIAKRIAGQAVMAGHNPHAEKPSDDKPKRAYKSRRLQTWERLPKRVKGADDPNFEMLTDHEVLQVMAKPNPMQRKFEFFFVSVANLLLTGECYWIGGKGKSKGRGKEDAPIELWAIPTTWITPLHENGLFTGYNLKAGDGEPIPLKPEQVARTYFPDPSNIKSSLSPVITQISAIRTDDYIQTSQEDSFKRGIFPNVAIKVGQQIGEDGKPTGARPVLEGHQRRQIIRAVRQVWDRSVGNGDPAILDGLIEDVFKLHTTPQEMDWLQSGAQVKARIFEAFGVHPFMAGEPVGVGGYAQAAIIEGVFADNANTIVDALGETLTGFLGPLYDDPPMLQVWLDPIKPRNEEMRAKEWEFARRNEDVTRDEYRAERLSLPPSEEKPRLKLLETVGGVQCAVSIVTAVGQGVVQPDNAKEIFKLFYQVDESVAAALVGEAMPVAAPVNPPVAGEPPEEDALEEPDEPEPGEKATSLITKSGRLSRQAIAERHVKQLTALERGLAKAMASFFRGAD